MDENHMEFIKKIMEAKRLEHEALMILLPEKMQKHVSVISKELKAMVVESIIDFAEKFDGESSENSSNPQEHLTESNQSKESTDIAASGNKVKKIDIS